MPLTLHATRRPPRGACFALLVLASACLVAENPDVLRAGICRDGRVYGHTYDYGHIEYTPPSAAWVQIKSACIFHSWGVCEYNVVEA